MVVKTGMYFLRPGNLTALLITLSILSPFITYTFYLTKPSNGPMESFNNKPKNLKGYPMVYLTSNTQETVSYGLLEVILRF